MPAFSAFCDGGYLSRSRSFDAQRTVNLYPERSESGTSKNKMCLIGTPGLRPWLELVSNTCRGGIVKNENTAYVVVGPNVYKVTVAGIFTTIGTIDNDTTPVVMSSNGTDIFIATGPKGYKLICSTDTVSEIVDASFTGADRVDFVKGNFVFNQPGTGKFWSMDPYSFTLDPLYFATAEGSPDNLVTLIVDHEEVWLFGDNTTEVWAYNGDTTNFPYQRVTGAFIESGCAAKHSVAKMDNSIFWLSADERGQGIVMRANGYTPQRVSDHAIEHKIALFSKIDDAIAFTYQQGGHQFYQLTFPTEDWTCTYDAATQKWHERSQRYEDGTEGRHRANFHMFFGRQNIVGDYLNGKLYIYDLNHYMDDANQIIRRRAAPHLVAQTSTKEAYSSFILDMERGVGLQEGQGSDPQANLRFSDDGGFTWSYEKSKPIGKVGERRPRIRWNRLGSSYDRVFEITIADPVKVVITGAWVNE